ncbi:MAG: 6,7-dimethyl-8-ribityllumazine synthase [Gammaproteobacteria bacterium]|nr:6,7-dimethyl-8-ribityllumazine synthase [Gammaproteobacteria bacterium]
MAQTAIDLSKLPNIENPGRVAILKSKWYPELVDSLSRTCERVLKDNGFTRVEVHTLPGSLELPLAAADLLATDTQHEIDAIICFSVILKGETLHFEMITNECMRGLGDVMRQYRRPVIVEILPVLEMAHAQARAGDDEFNKGYEAAAAAIEMIAWRRSVGA